MAEVQLNAEIRELKGKKVERLRREGKVPAVFYIHGEENINIAIAEKSLNKLIYSKGISTINLILNNGIEKKCILREVQFDPIKDNPIHADFLGIRADEEITVEVPVVITGETPLGVREGGMLQHLIHKLKISCLPQNMPSHIEINAENLHINEAIHIKDIKVSNFTILENENNTVLAILPPAVEKTIEAATPSEVITEPEVVAKGKKATEEEGEEK